VQRWILLGGDENVPGVSPGVAGNGDDQVRSAVGLDPVDGDGTGESLLGDSSREAADIIRPAGLDQAKSFRADEDADPIFTIGMQANLPAHAVGDFHEALVALASDDGSVEEVCAADEGRDEGIRRSPIQILGGSELLKASIAENGDPVGQRKSLLLVVGDEDGGDPDTFQEGPELVASSFAESGIQVR
jgi:hypothetical protein